MDNGEVKSVRNWGLPFTILQKMQLAEDAILLADIGIHVV